MEEDFFSEDIASMKVSTLLNFISILLFHCAVTKYYYLNKMGYRAEKIGATKLLILINNYLPNLTYIEV